MSTAVLASSYIEQGWSLCQFRSGTKGEGLVVGWNLPEHAIRNPEAIRNGNNIGLLHVSSRTCVLDLDALDLAEDWFADQGFALADALEADNAVQICSGRFNRDKLLYRLPSGIDPAKMKTIKITREGGEVLFEFRCATGDGKSVQDVLPPSIHPVTGRPYEWKGNWRDLPTLPDQLLSIWQGLISQNSPYLASKHDNDDEGEIITPRTIGELHDALTFIPSEDRDLWVRLGHGLKTIGPKGKDLWLKWSAKSAKFDKAEANRVWDTFKPSHTSHKVVFAEAQSHGWQNPARKTPDAKQQRLNQIDLGTLAFQPTEFVLDGFIPTGVSAIAGAWGAGKSTNLIPLFASVAHLAPSDWGFRPDLRRHVVWITEAPEQALDTLKSLARADGAADWQEFADWFHLFRAHRQSAGEMAAQVKDLTEQLTYRNNRGFEVKPVVTLDTTAANLDIENESDNSHVSRAMAVLKQTLPGIPLVLVGHTPKALIKADVGDMTFRGAGAWEADAAATYYLVHDQKTDMRFLAIRKCRFTPAYREIDFGQEGGSVILDTHWGASQTKHYLHGVPSKSNGETRKVAVQKIQDQNREERKERAKSERQQKIMEHVRQCASEGSFVTRATIHKAIGGSKALQLEAINRLIESGALHEHPLSKHHIEAFGIKLNAPYPDAILPAEVLFDLYYVKATEGNHQ